MPREIRDEIYHLAFNQDRRMFKVTSLAYLMQRIREERRRYQLRVPHSMSNSTTRTIAARMTPDTVPGCPLERMRVCKQFFDEAASAWLRSHTIICGDNLESIEAFMRSSAVRAHLTGLAYRAGGNFLIPEISPVFKHLSNLRTFSLLIGDYCFDDVKCRLCWFHDLQPRDFEQVTFPVEILNIETLEKIKLEPKVSELAITQQEQNKWKHNVAAFEIFLNAELKTRAILRGSQGHPRIQAVKPANSISEEKKAKREASSRQISWHRYLWYPVNLCLGAIVLVFLVVISVPWFLLAAKLLSSIHG